MLLRLVAACALLVGVLPAEGASTEAVRSSSSQAIAAVGGQVSAITGTERDVLGRMSPERLAALAERDTSRTESGIFGRRAAAPRNWTAADIDTLPRAEGDAQWACLKEAIYFEARGESIDGQFAVAEVVLNRVESDRFPDTICRVVRQGANRRNACQFSYACNGLSDVMHEREARERAGKIARLMIDGADRHRTGGAKYFHARHVNPRWARVFQRTATIGAHHFYSKTAEVASN